MRRTVGEEVETGFVGAKVVGVEVVGGGSHVVTACRNWNKDTCNGIVWR